MLSLLHIVKTGFQNFFPAFRNEKINMKWVYGILFFYIALNCLFITQEIFWFPVLSLLLLIVYLAFYHLDYLFFLLVLVTPLSIILENKDLNVAISMPAEALMIAASIGVAVKLFYDGTLPRKILIHPVTIAVLINFSWIFFTCFTSELPLVSLKFAAARTWFFLSCYLLAIMVFKKFSNIKLFTWVYMVPLAGVIIYSIARHSGTGFDEHHAHWVMWPFYNDHTAYGAILAFFIPVLAGYLFSRHIRTGVLSGIAVFLFLILFGTALVLSYSRAAWISTACAFIMLIFILLKVRFIPLLLSAVILIFCFFNFRNDIMITLEKNRQISSDELIEHVQSIYNITTDVSNTERLNRWNSAFRMFLERPVMGWGPGTFMFLYAPFQLSSDMTWVSTNAGNLGNAHSEYIGPLAESGLPGSVSFLLIALVTCYVALRFMYNSSNRIAKDMFLVIFLGLVTYFAHGLVNNFLDTDKASVPFWGFLAAIVALDVYHNRPENNPESNKNIINQ
ncbi:MAG: O-antigen ligase family protein [Bacteroidetes bacterium]|nr:O-antigen ligase family protein [Bacteroidota bacterium]